MAAEERNDELNESWVDLSETPTVHAEGSIQSAILAHGGDLERLLIEAQRESTQSSRHTSNKSSQKGSPRSPHSPVNGAVDMTNVTKPMQEQIFQEISQEWIWDWSSRPDIQPPSGLEKQMKHPAMSGRRPRMSVRHTCVMKDGVFIWENLPALLVTHACSFMLGAAIMFLYMRKYWVPVVVSLTD